MGCFSFSYICQECGEPINSDSFTGERCVLFLLENGKILQKMQGEYDSYGKVFIDNTTDDRYEHLRKSENWEIGWGKCIDMHFSGRSDTGFAAFHERCYHGQIPLEKSENDPNQGWGEYEEGS